MFDRATVFVLLVSILVCLHLNGRQQRRLQEHEIVVSRFTDASVSQIPERSEERRVGKEC